MCQVISTGKNPHLVEDPVDFDKLLVRAGNPGPDDRDRLLRDFVDLQLNVELERV
jgi:hypothetical protein